MDLFPSSGECLGGTYLAGSERKSSSQTLDHHAT